MVRYHQGPETPSGGQTEGVIYMVRVIMGVKGTGKTKQMIELINAAAQNESGSVEIGRAHV